MSRALPLCFALLLLAPGALAQPVDPSFEPVARVLLHPRCANCHPQSDQQQPQNDAPLQGNGGHRHAHNVVRGPDDGHGVRTFRCATCHRKANYAATGVPGADDPKKPETWHLAPPHTGWHGMTPHAVCERLKAAARHEGKTIEDAMHHVYGDPLVTWAWEPGGGRSPPPGTHQDVVRDVKTWLEARAPCDPTR